MAPIAEGTYELSAQGFVPRDQGAGVIHLLSFPSFDNTTCEGPFGNPIGLELRTAGSWLPLRGNRSYAVRVEDLGRISFQVLVILGPENGGSMLANIDAISFKLPVLFQDGFE